jgi:phosphate starvation-inducible PhoH-like protein
MTTVPDSTPTPEIHVQFDDNRLLPLLFGEHDKHLVQIEQRLGVSLISRGNHVVISGPEDAPAIARLALNRLYDRVQSGQSIELADVDAAVRMTVAGQSVALESEPVVNVQRKQISARTPAQASYIRAIAENDMVFGLGPAGTGKTYLAVCVAVEMLLSGKVDHIVLSRPAVEAGERLGFLPGDMREKVDPYLRPLYDALHDALSAEQVSRRLGSGEIEVAPLAFMRGRTLSNAFVILDEAQNATSVQMKMFLTRLGENSRMVVTGDPSQTDLPKGERSGLLDAVETVCGVDGICFITFSDADVVRNPLVTKIVRAYDARSTSPATGLSK